MPVLFLMQYFRLSDSIVPFVIKHLEYLSVKFTVYHINSVVIRSGEIPKDNTVKYSVSA